MGGWTRIMPGKDVDDVIGTCICCETKGRMGAILYNYAEEDPITMCKSCFSETEDSGLTPKQAQRRYEEEEPWHLYPIFLEPEQAISILRFFYDSGTFIPEGSDLDTTLRSLLLSAHHEVTYWASKALIKCSEHGLELVKELVEFNYINPKNPARIQDAIDESDS